MTTVRQRRVIFGAIVVMLGVLVGYSMFFSLTPATHLDHDHGLANLDAGGFLRLERVDGGRRNFVGKPGKILIMHWFSPGMDISTREIPEILAFREVLRPDPEVEVVLVADAGGWDEVLPFTDALGVPREVLYLDRGRATGRLFGIRRIPETLFYDPFGKLARQAYGTMAWQAEELLPEIARFKRGVREIH